MKKKYELTKAQMGVLYSFDESGNIVITDKNYIWGHLKINEMVDFKGLKEAVNYCLKKNDSMRIKLCLKDDKLYQYFESHKDIDFETIKVNSDEEIKDLENEIINKPFSMFDSFLFKIAIYNYKGESGGIIIKLHHVIADGYTIGMLLYQIVINYKKITSKYVTFSYKDYISSEEKYPSTRRYELDKIYWNNMFKKRIPDSAYFPSKKTKYSMLDANKLTFDIDENILNSIRKFCKDNRISMSMFFMSIYAVFIYKVTKLEYFFMSSVSDNRRNFKEKLTAGMLTNTAYFDVRIQNMKFSDFIKEIYYSLSNGYKHMNYINNYTRELFDEYNDKRILPTNITISYQKILFDKEKMKINCDFKGDSNVGTYASDIVIIHVLEQNDNLKIIYDYLSEKYSIEEITQINNEIVSIIKQVISNKDINIQDINL